MTVDPQACRNLWRAVLSNAVIEASGAVVGGSGKVSEYTRRNIIRNSQDYLTGNSRDFRHVCELAGLEAWQVREAFKAGKLSQKALTGHVGRTGKGKQ